MDLYTIHVSVEGEGFLEAKEKIKVLRNQGHKGDVEVLVEPGKYFIEAPITLTPEECGEGQITFRAHLEKAEDEVILTGAKTLTISKWEDYEKNPNIKVTQIEKNLHLDGLVVDGELQVLCRYPNYIEGTVPLGSATDAATIKERAKSYERVETGYIRALHDYRWGGNSYQIVGRDEDSPTGLKLRWVGDNNRGSRFDSGAMVIENVLEELDVPGEWYYDNEAGKLYFYPGELVDLTTAQFEGVMTSEIFRLQGEKDGEKVKNIILEGFKISHTKRTLFTIDEPGKAYVPLLRGDWCVVRSGAITLVDSEQITLRNLVLEHIGGNGIFMSGYNRNHLVENNEICHLGATGIQVVGLPEAVHEPSFWEHDHYPELTVHKNCIDYPQCTGPRTEHYPLEITLSNNHIWDVGIFEKQSSGINVSVASRCRMLHNTIHNSPRSCININDGTFGGHEVAYNDIFDAQKETMDHGPFNSWGRDRFWSVPNYNASGLYGDKIKAYSLIDVVETIYIHDNRLHHGADQPHTWGIDLDDGSSNYEIYNNLCLGMGVKLREGFKRRVYNNIFVDGSINIHCTYQQAEDEIYSNIVVGSHNWEFAGQDGGDEKRVTEGCYQIDHNCYYDQEKSVQLPSFFEKHGYDEHAIRNESPVFRAPENNDYTVTNKALLEAIGFKNFEMDEFGQTGCKIKSPCYEWAYKTRRYSEQTSWLDAQISSIDDGIISSTASYGYDGVYFYDVPATSKAYALGFRTRDIVKEIDGVGIKGLEDFMRLIGQGDVVWACEIKLYRDTTSVILNI